MAEQYIKNWQEHEGHSEAYADRGEESKADELDNKYGEKIMEAFFALVKSIPGAVWAAIFASILTLSGVLVTNRANYKRMKEQLLHDAEERDKERKMDLRRQVYLEVAEAITANYTILNRFPDLTVTDSDLSKQFSNSAVSISKVNVIGSDRTIKAVSDLSLAISRKYLELTAKRLPLVQRQQEINMQNRFLTQSAAERDRMIELMKEYNLQGSEDKRLWNVINNNFEFEKKRCDEFIAKINELRRINSQGQIQLSLECFEASKEISKFFIPAISAVREEMGIPFDADSFRKVLEGSWKLSQQSVSEFFNRITGKVG